jgi:flagellar assembly protein FliH
MGDFLQQAAAKNGKEMSGQVEVYQYPMGSHGAPHPVWEGWGDPSAAAGKAHEPMVSNPDRVQAEAAMRAEFDKRLAEETRKAYEAGREKGRLEGRQAEREAQAASTAVAGELHRRQAAELLENFVQERDRYLHRAEHEVVELALAVAARILRREAQMDPLLLTGAVRVALGQLAGTTEVRLRVPATELALWTEAIALIPNLALKPAVIAGDEMRLGDCIVETGLGSVDLGIRAQLGEIERGFFDRPAGSRAGAQSELEASGAAAGHPHSGARA